MDNKGNYSALTWIAVQAMQGLKLSVTGLSPRGNRIRSQAN